jgi:hypothetical protein
MATTATGAVPAFGDRHRNIINRMLMRVSCDLLLNIIFNLLKS